MVRPAVPARRRAPWIALAVVAAAAGGLWAAAAWRRPLPVATARVTRGDLLVRVLCDGKLEPPEGGELRTAEGGTVAEVDVRDGSRVRRGERLLRLVNPELETRARDAKAELRRLESEAAAVAAELAREQREAAYRRQLLDGDRRLLDSAAISRAAYDANQLAWQQAAERERAARAQLEQLARVAGPSRVSLARAASADLARRVAALALRSPAAGVAYGLPRARGELVAPGQLVASVTDPDHPHVRFRVDQPDVTRVAVGQRLIVTFSGLPDRQWPGTVRRAAAGLREAGGREVGEGIGELSDPVHALPVNASVDVEVIVAQKHGVLIVPRAALRSGRSGQSGRSGRRGGGGTGGGRFVLLLEGERARERPVEVGLIGLAEAEVVRGLAAGDRVILSGPPMLAEGSRVIAARP
ncbi:MAG TPA: HlyD family efflux transporter periplasmic adaptor subunit [Thermoanaerobaculia bacterium]|nr:HlyD family efflux transporter periplasmic adaptor subunit [Thermoanaerobaculia bacterium]